MNIKLARGRQAFNPYNIIGELQLMRQYPNVLYEWLSKDEKFKKDSPHATKILEYLKTAPKRRVGQKCVLRDMCAWSFAYHEALNGTSKFAKFADIDVNYYNHDFGMLVHMKSRLKNWTAHGYLVDSVYTNDFGVYDLIVHTLLNDKDERLWELLLKNDNYGVDNVAFATSKKCDKWTVTINY